MKRVYRVVGPQSVPGYPAYEIVWANNGGTYTAAYVHDKDLAEVMCDAINRKKTRSR